MQAKSRAARPSRRASRGPSLRGWSSAPGISSSTGGATRSARAFFDDLLVPSIGLQLWAHRPCTPSRRRRVLLAVAGGLGAVTWFGKPTCVLYSAAQALVIVVDDEVPDRGGPDLRAFALGCGVACVFMFALL